MNSLAATLNFFIYIMLELTILFLGISTLVGWILHHISEAKLQHWLSQKGLWGYLMGSALGVITPFCACSTIPLTVGMLKAKVPFGPVMSFVVISPLINPILLTMMATLYGIKAAIIYGLVTFTMAIVFGILMQYLGFSRYIKQMQISGSSSANNLPKGWTAHIRSAFMDSWKDYVKVLPYLVIGVALGAVIKGYIPEELVIRMAGPENPASIPIAALIGIPLYIRATTAIPIGLALIQKGMATGAVIALIIGGSGMAIPEMSLLAGIFRLRLVGALVGIIFITAVLAGFIFNVA